MKSNPILEEAWRVKDQLAAEAGYDIDRFFDNLRQWEAEHPFPGPIIRNADELRQAAAEKGRRQAEESALTLNDKSPSDLTQRRKDAESQRETNF